MCGIAGIYNKNGLDTDARLITHMSAALEHRGPDQEGFHIDPSIHLAARRLRIIDLQEGAQPIYSPDRSHCIVYNGELYNYREIREHLAGRSYAFSTGTDTEVVLAAYVTWGPSCLERFRGMFAFAIWNTRSRELFLARDRFGIKPVYTTCLPDGTFLFASEIKSLLQHPKVPRRLNPQAVDHLLTYGFNPAPHTFFDSIDQLLPGHWLKKTPGGEKTVEYWDINLEAPISTEDDNELAEKTRDAVTRAVQNSLVSDVPVAAYLSGGIDSSVITGLYSGLRDDPVTALTITFAGADYDETAYSRQVASLFNTNNIEFPCTIGRDDISRLVYHLENPLVSLLNLPLFLLSKKARELGIRVVLSGDGADETIGGYRYFKIIKAMDFIKKTESLFRKNILQSLFPFINTPRDAEALYERLKQSGSAFPVSHPAVPYRFQAFQQKSQLLTSDFYDAAMHAHSAGSSPFFFDLSRCACRPLIDQALYIDTKMRLLNLTLPLSDKMSMANGVEMRPLFLDHELVDFFFTLPHHVKIRGLTEKYILKKSMRRLLPDGVCTRRKQPLQPPASVLISAAGDMLRDMLSPAQIKKAGIFNPRYIETMLAAPGKKGQVDYSGLVITCFFVQLWHHLFLENDACSTFVQKGAAYVSGN